MFFRLAGPAASQGQGPVEQKEEPEAGGAQQAHDQGVGQVDPQGAAQGSPRGWKAARAPRETRVRRHSRPAYRMG